MAVRTRKAAPVAGRDYFCCVVHLEDGNLEIKDRETQQPKEVEITRFYFVVDTETAGYYDLEAVAWGDTGEPAPWSNRSLAGRILKSALNLEDVPESFDDQQILFKPFLCTLKEQLSDGTVYYRIDEVKPIPAPMRQGSAREAIQGQINELIQAAKTGKQVVPDSQERKQAQLQQDAATSGADLEEFEDIPF